MVATRSSGKESAVPSLATASNIEATNNVPKPAKSTSKGQKSSIQAELSPSEQQKGIHAAPPAARRQVTGKRKRAGGDSREPPNVGQRKKQRTSEEDAPLEDDDAGPSFDLPTFQAFITQLDSRAKCARCHHSLRGSLDVQSHVNARSPLPVYDSSHDWTASVAATLVLSAAHCPTNHCGGITCIGCGKDINQDAKRDASTHAIYGCQLGWYVALWMQLAYANLARAPTVSHAKDANTRRSSSKSVASKASKHSHHPTAPAGTGYASGSPSMDNVEDTKPRAQAAEDEKLIDKRDQALFSTVSLLLRHLPSATAWTDAGRDSMHLTTSESSGPTTRRSRSSRKSEPASETNETPLTNKVLLPTLFYWSGILQALSRLFRNDCLEDAFSRRTVYDAGADLVEALLANDSTSRLVTDKTYDAVKANPGAPESTFSAFPTFEATADKITSSDDHDVESASIAESMDNILVACETLFNAAASMPKVYKDRTSREMLRFAERIQAIGERLGKTAPKVKTVGTNLPQATSSAERFEMVDEADMTKKFTRNKDVVKISGIGAPARIRALHREVSMLRTSLPTGIWVKMASTRPDIVKALIVGPEGTPYEGGLFEFDMLCPRNYPSAPPKVDCATCAREEARPFSLNPNLYNNGYVCLSVINTWHGAKQEQWLPGKSTLLQVLISIQSMVLGTATPADNEPGGLGMPHEAYNRTIQPGTIKAALLPWLQVEELKKGVWAAEVQAYFKANAAQILDTVRGWAKDNKRIKEFSAYPMAHMEPIEDWEASSPAPVPAVSEPQASGGSHPHGDQGLEHVPLASHPISNQGATAVEAHTGDNGHQTPSFEIPDALTGTMLPSADGESSEVPPEFPPPAPPAPPAIDLIHLGPWPAKTSEKKRKTVDLLEELEKALKEYL